MHAAKLTQLYIYQSYRRALNQGVLYIIAIVAIIIIGLLG